MAVSMTPAMQAEIRILPGNDKCVDCGSNHPQWASVTYGALMCLECSGAHRGMGVHISFVRSVTMDSWSDKQLKMMTHSSNDELSSFLEEAQRRPAHAPQREVPRARVATLCGSLEGEGGGQAVAHQITSSPSRADVGV